MRNNTLAVFFLVLLASLAGSAFFSRWSWKSSVPRDRETFQSENKRPFIVSRRAPGVRVLDKGALIPPESGEIDWALMVVLKPFKPKNRSVITVKYDHDKSPYAGYGLALSRIGAKYYPEVYWRSEKAGGWHLFPAFELTDKRWYALVLIRSAGFVTLFVGDLGEELIRSGVKLTYKGAYDVSDFGPIHPQEGLLIGTPYGKPFHGAFRLAAVVTGENLLKDPELLLQGALAFPNLKTQFDTLFLTRDGESDLSAYQHPINPVSSP